MSIKFVGFTGIFVSIFFIVGFILLFIINPQVFDEINNIGLTAYNLEGMKGQWWARNINYISAGILNALFAVLLFGKMGKDVTGKIACVFLFLSGGIWITFGVLTYIPASDVGNSLMLSRIILMIFMAWLGLVLLGAGTNKISRDSFLK